ESDPPEVKTILADYENRGEAERTVLIKQVAGLGDDKGLAVLCRMVRFERSTVLSKVAAAAVIGQKWPADAAAAERRAETIRRGIGQSGRTAAAWLKWYVAGHQDAAAAIDEWQKLVAAEEHRATETPHQTRPEIVAALWREQAVLLRKLGRERESDEILLRLVDREEGSISGESLEELLRWLVEQRAFNVVDHLAGKFADRLQAEPTLLYALADARKAEGKDDLVRETVARALKLGGDDQNAYEQHHRVGIELMRRHRWRWAEGEFRRVAELAGKETSYSIDARARVSEILHDRGDDRQAAEVLELAVGDMEKNVQEGNEQSNAGRTLETTRARMHYFFACSLVKQDERNERIRRLLDAVSEDPTDADALIALYRIKDLDPPLVEQNRGRIRSAAEQFRQQIQQQPDDPTPYNQFAWLVANTEGDYQEALRYSEKSLELVRANPRLSGSEASLLDTLGRCHYAVGDYENAVKAQSRAVELDPESGLMSKQLGIFREALKEANGAPNPGK
ncbi:MAG TPA: tetratricopeptide repeat protein, partial [Pirellulales bacterium]|nr:tetratricopeptide repeat protein [Pirellulales bacterium]